MPTRKLIKLPKASGSGTGLQEVTGAIGWEYFKLIGIAAAGPAITDFTNFQPLINNKSIWENIDGIDLDAIRKVDVLTPFATSRILCIDFEREHFIDGVPRQATSINTLFPSAKTGKAITNFGLKYTQAVAGNIDWWAEVLPADPVGPGYIKRLEKKGGNLQVGYTEFNSLPYGAKDVLHAQWARVFMQTANPATNIVEVELKNGSDSIIERVPKAINDQLLADGLKVPGTFFNYVLDFSRYGMPEDLDVLGIAEKNLKLNINSDAVDSVSIIVESLGEID